MRPCDTYFMPQNIQQVQRARENANKVIAGARQVAYQTAEVERRWLNTAKREYETAFAKLQETGIWPDGKTLQEYFCAQDFLELQTTLVLMERNPYRED